MKIAYFKDFIKDKKLEKTLQKLKDEDFSQVKKLSNSPYFRIKVDYENRIIFQFLRYRSENYILVLEYIPNHEYEKSKFLKGKKPSEEDFIFPEDIEEAIFINEKKEFRHLEKFISFSESQEDILTAKPPIILIGSAGSGKTSVLIEKLRTLNGKTLYISLSKNLVEKSKEICNCSEKIEFQTFQELFKIENEIDFEKFKMFAVKHKIKEVEKFFEEFRGVITGTSEKSYLSKEDYFELGKKLSIFPESERESIYEKFKRYLEFLKKESLVDSNMEKLQTSQNYDFIVIDEVQDFTNSQISAILKNGDSFILAGDSNQIIYSNFFSWDKLKTMLFKSEDISQISILRENYRNSQNITNISNKLLKIKQLRFGSIDRESNYLIETVSNIKGEILFWSRSEIAEELNRKKRDDVTFAVIVFDEKAKIDAKKRFDTPLIFTVQEAKGLEYPNIILFNFVSNEAKKFLEIVTNIRKNDLEKELKYSRPKDKSDRELDEFKIYINSLYVAFTRGIENLYIVETKEHKIWEVLGVVESKKAIFEQTSSTDESWTEEAQRLQKFGRTEQIEEIEKRNKEKISAKEYTSNLKKDIFENGKDTKSNRAKLFKIAKKESDLKTIRIMAERLSFKNAQQFLKKLGKESFDLAIQNRDLEKLKVAIESGYSIKGYNIWELVKEKDNLDFLELLLKNGADAESKDDFGNRVLFLALDRKKSEIVKLLLENGANPNLQRNDGVTALIMASENGHREIVELLLENGANPDLQAKDGDTALIMASVNGHREIVELLIENKANPNLQNKEGGTALMFASQNGHREIVELLLNSGANPDLEAKDGGTTLIIASEKGHREIVELLLNGGTNPNLQVKDGWTALIWASEKGDREIVELLLNSGANPNLQTNNGETALMYASQEGYREIVELLLNSGANFDLQNKYGVTALAIASLNGHREIVELLLNRDANPDLQNIKGRTALMVASQNGHIEIVELLLNRGANPDLQTNSLDSLENFEKEKTALQIAKHYNHYEIVELLQKTGAKEETGL